MASDPKEKLSLDWMYEGPSSTINREDYLTGKKIDKNFEKSNSDFHEPPSKLDYVIQNKSVSSAPTSSKSVGVTSALLDLETIKKEDPLVAIKVREEKIRREMLENPLKMKRLQKIVMKSMEKKMKKFLEKRRQQSSSDSTSESDDSDRVRQNSSRERRGRKDYQSQQSGKKRKSFDKSNKRHRKSKERDERRKSPDRYRDRLSTDHSDQRRSSDNRREGRHKIGKDWSTANSEKREANYKVEHHHRSIDRLSPRSRVTSQTDRVKLRDRSPQSPKRPSDRKRRSPEHHRRSISPLSPDRSHRSLQAADRSHDGSSQPIVRHRHDSSSSSASSETTEKARRYAGYGLIHVKERKDTAKSAPAHRTLRKLSPNKEQEKPSSLSKMSKQQKPARKPLSEEEMEKRRQEMMENAKWRDEQRKRNLKRLANEEEDQAKRDTKRSSDAVDFIRSMVAKSTDHDSVEGRVRSKIQRLQRSVGAMESNFVRK